MKKQTTKSNPLVSVVMPAYNSEKYIAEAIESILNQTYKNFEFIIVNDASTDKTLEIIKKYAKKDKRIKLIENKVNLKICKSLNKGIKQTNGKYIARMDADDISMPNRFKEQVEFLENNPEVGIVGGFIDIFDGETNKRIGIRKYPADDKTLKEKIFFYSPFAHPTVMIRRDVIKRVGVYKEADFPSEDLAYWFRIGKKFKFANLQKITLKYRYYSKSTTGSRIRMMEKKANEMRWKQSKDPSFNFTTKAFLYNLGHTISIYIIPSKFKFWMFSLWRDRKK